MRELYGEQQTERDEFPDVNDGPESARSKGWLWHGFAALVVAAALLWRPEGITALLGLALSAGTFGAFMLTVTVGLFGFGTGWDLEAVVAAVAEIGAILLLGLWWVITTRKRGAPALGERVVAD